LSKLIGIYSHVLQFSIQLSAQHIVRSPMVTGSHIYPS